MASASRRPCSERSLHTSRSTLQNESRHSSVHPQNNTPNVDSQKNRPHTVQQTRTERACGIQASRNWRKRGFASLRQFCHFLIPPRLLSICRSSKIPHSRRDTSLVSCTGPASSHSYVDEIGPRSRPFSLATRHLHHRGWPSLLASSTRIDRTSTREAFCGASAAHRGF